MQIEKLPSELADESRIGKGDMQDYYLCPILYSISNLKKFFARAWMIENV